ncbi:glycosyltransferase family 2 protein [Aquitalea aquatica]|uniref:Glycosyltransferase family 2 protein n=1 Tax=Aquitalea aquatica TaxID=3044273 RepID=A0A838Y6F5_9NEIS|nr:glycosyltransferase family 2 protein [Aquitalea magnusonii]MBA4708159.1 glycosyltransferase family 2 protein [Aquitalea magnusonii]
MTRQVSITASLVLFQNPKDQITALLHSVQNSNRKIDLIIIDNSPTNELEKICSAHEYHFVGENIGFGKGHNLAIKSLRSDFHILLNPDITFESNLVNLLIMPMIEDPSVVGCSPKVLYPDGRLQRLTKLLPTPINLLARRFLPPLSKMLDYDYEMQWLDPDKPFELSNASGCLFAFRTDVFQKLNGFDERFFMYMEDIDLSRRMAEIGRLRYIPQAEVVHIHAKESYKNKKLLLIHLKSAWVYFNKWGWFFDKKRNLCNKKTLAQKTTANIG